MRNMLFQLAPLVGIALVSSALHAQQTDAPASDTQQAANTAVALYDAGERLMEQKHYAEAIAAFSKVLDNDGIPANDRHLAAVQISHCHERLKAYDKALEWLAIARTKYPYETWCGTCRAQHEVGMDAMTARLLQRSGNYVEALELAERYIFGGDLPFHEQFIAVVVDDYAQRNRLTDLDAKLQKAVASPLEEGWVGETPLIQGVRKYAAFKRLAVARKYGQYWQAFLSLETSPANLLDARRHDWLSWIVADDIAAQRQAFRGLLRHETRRNPSTRQAWALLLLARMNEATYEDVERSLLRTVELRPGPEREDVKRDYLAVLWQLDRGRAAVDFDRYARDADLGLASAVGYVKQLVRHAIADE